LVRKKIRKNYFKNSSSRHRAEKIQHIANLLKITAALVLVALMSCIFIFGYDLLTQSNYFKVVRLKVEGCDILFPEEVLEQAEIASGMNIFSINLTTTRKRLLAHPWITDAEVGREIPAGINIKIREHDPLAIIDLDRRFLLNRQGEIFKEWETTDPVNLPVVDGLEFSDLNVDGRSFSRPFSAVLSVLKLGQKGGSALTNKEIHRIEVDRDIGLTIHVNNSLNLVKLGYDNYPNKYRRLKEVIYYLRKNGQFRKFRSIDINNPDRIVVNINQEDSTAIGNKEV
jgi:cell division protein FtsQ